MIKKKNTSIKEFYVSLQSVDKTKIKLVEIPQISCNNGLDPKKIVSNLISYP